MRIVSPLPQKARHGACVNCGSSSSKRKYFDLEVFIDFEGGLYICEACVTEMAHELDFITKDDHKFVKENNKRLLSSNTELRLRIEQQNAVIDTLSAERIERESEQRFAVENARIAAIQETESRYPK